MLKHNDSDGFTLIELLVVILIISVLAAMALPSFLNQANRARLVAAKTTIGATNRAQQLRFVEKGSFATDYDSLALGIQETTPEYQFTINATSNSATVVADPATETLPGAGGRVFVVDQNTFSVLCEGRPGRIPTNLEAATDATECNP